jgi:hypothetical protein
MTNRKTNLAENVIGLSLTCVGIRETHRLVAYIWYSHYYRMVHIHQIADITNLKQRCFSTQNLYDEYDSFIQRRLGFSS